MSWNFMNGNRGADTWFNPFLDLNTVVVELSDTLTACDYAGYMK